ncbi:MAG: hypothetical protein ACYS26_17950 [Planctomycetota bacterium]|jgi:hypothetical protein
MELLCALSVLLLPAASEIEVPEFETLQIPLGRQPQVVHLLENRFCASDCAVAHDLISTWYRVDAGPSDTIAGFTPYYHARGETLQFSDHVNLQTLLPKNVEQDSTLGLGGPESRNIPAGSSRVCNSEGGLYELYSGQLNYLAPAPWPADEFTQVGCEIDQAFAFRPGELRMYDGGQWKLEAVLETGPGSVQGDGDFATRDGSGDSARLRLFERHPLGWWAQSDSFEGAAVDGLSHFRWTDQWVVCNHLGTRWCLLQRDGNGGLLPVLEWSQPEESDAFQWLYLDEQSGLLSLIELVEPEELALTRLTADVTELPASGGSQALRAEFPSTYNGAIYFALGSASGTSPGILYSAFAIDLNPDVYFNYLLTTPSDSPLLGQTGKLDSLGRAYLEFDLTGVWAPGSPLAGYQVHHAVLAFNDNVPGLSMVGVTPPAGLLLTP